MAVSDTRAFLRSRGERSSDPDGVDRRSCAGARERTLRQWIKAEPDLTLAQLRERLAVQGVQI